MKLIYLLLIVLVLSACASTGEKKEEVEVFKVDLKSQNIPLGEIEVQLPPLMGLGKIKKIVIPVLYFPREDAVCLQYKKDFITYHQFWNKKGRQDFINALAMYNEEYDSRTLKVNSGRKEKQAYGITQGYLTWQQFSFSILAKAPMDIQLGYTFKERTPYFLVSQLEADYIDPMTRDQNRRSLVIPFFFTRAQAANLEVLFDQSILNGFIQEHFDKINTEDNYFEEI